MTSEIQRDLSGREPCWPPNSQCFIPGIDTVPDHNGSGRYRCMGRTEKICRPNLTFFLVTFTSLFLGLLQILPAKIIRIPNFTTSFPTVIREVSDLDTVHCHHAPYITSPFRPSTSFHGLPTTTPPPCDGGEESHDNNTQRFSTFFFPSGTRKYSTKSRAQAKNPLFRLQLRAPRNQQQMEQAHYDLLHHHGCLGDVSLVHLSSCLVEGEEGQCH